MRSQERLGMDDSGAQDIGSVAGICELIESFWALSPENTLSNGSAEKAWDKPLIGFARAAHPLFDQYAQDLAPFYWTPVQAFKLGFPETKISTEDLSIVSWVLPQTSLTRADQKKCDKVPSERWARARDFGERFNCALRLHVASELTKAGHQAVAPERLAEFSYQRSEKFGIASNWSERHTAHAAGLGTFGLSDGLITPLGKAVRLGSVIVRLKIPVDPLPYANHQAWCLWYAKGSCGVCARRCPVDAISSEGHDKERCHAYIRQTTAPYAQQNFGTQATPCGLCQVGIPCEARVPVKGVLPVSSRLAD